MQNLRYRIEAWFALFADFIYDNRLKAIILMLGLTLGLLSQLPKLTIDTSNEGFLHKNDPILLDYNAFRNQFGRDETVIVAIQTSNIFELPFLVKLRQIHEELESEVPYVDEITSLINARNTRGQADTLIVEDFKKAYEQCDVILSPVAPTPAFKIGEKADDPLTMYLSDIFTLSANLAGIPGMSVPCGLSGQGLPIGLQLMTEHFNEATLFRVAHNFEQATEFHKQKPEL